MSSVEEVSSNLQKLAPIHMEVIDESDGCGAKFKILVVSDAFNGKRVIECHRLVQEAIADLMPNIHAVTIQALSPSKRSNTVPNTVTPELDEYGDPIDLDCQTPEQQEIVEKFHHFAGVLQQVVHTLDEQLVLQVYALYKQATCGPADSKNRPSILDPRGRIKFDAWISLGDLDKFSAMQSYIEIVSSVAGSSDGGHKSTRGFGNRPSAMQIQDDESDNSSDPNASWFAAASSGDVDELAKRLGESKELLNVKDSSLAMTALLWATDAGQTEAVKFLLKEGADLSVVDNEGNTALHLAAICEHNVIFALLLENGANATSLNADGQSPIDLTM